jgi:hypothetical protein
MRWLVLLVCACTTYDPIAEVPHRHREVASTAAAISMILAENETPQVYAIGEYHQSRAAIAKTSPLARFTTEIIKLLEPHAKHLVVETWLDSACAPAPDVKATLSRPDVTQMEILRLVRSTVRAGLEAHALPITCIEYDSVVDASGHVDFLLLLELVTDKLAETTRKLVASDPDHAVIVYGGALHNDLYPRWPLDELSYAKPMAQDGIRVLEIDLVVPEVVAHMPMVRDEPWFPLLGRASPDRVIVWDRGPGSYVVILPAQDEAVATVAKLM